MSSRPAGTARLIWLPVLCRPGRHCIDLAKVGDDDLAIEPLLPHVR